MLSCQRQHTFAILRDTGLMAGVNVHVVLW